MQIGDLLFNTPCFRTLKENFPQTKIDLIASSKNYLLVKNNPHLNSVISFDKKQSLVKFWKLIGSLRKTKYDLVINFHKSERASFLASLMSSKKKIGLAKSLFKIFFDQTYQSNSSSDLHQVKEYLEIIKLLKLKIPEKLELEVFLGDLELSSQFLRNSDQILRQKRKIIGLNTGGSWPTKQWGQEKFRELSKKLIDKNYFLIFFGGEEDQVRSSKILEDLPSESILDLTDRTNLLETAYFMKFCSILVSGDSGPLHLAISQKTPVLGIFGPSNLERYFPYNQKQNTICLENLLCRACGLHTCNHHSCMSLLPVQEVFEKTLEILEEVDYNPILH